MPINVDELKPVGCERDEECRRLMSGEPASFLDPFRPSVFPAHRDMWLQWLRGKGAAIELSIANVTYELRFGCYVHIEDPSRGVCVRKTAFGKSLERCAVEAGLWVLEERDRQLEARERRLERERRWSTRASSEGGVANHSSSSAGNLRYFGSSVTAFELVQPRQWNQRHVAMIDYDGAAMISDPEPEPPMVNTEAEHFARTSDAGKRSTLRRGGIVDLRRITRHDALVGWYLLAAMAKIDE